MVSSFFTSSSAASIALYEALLLGASAIYIAAWAKGILASGIPDEFYCTQG